jgi:hypothetical protein
MKTYAILFICLLLLCLSVVGAHWNALVVVLLSFSVWLIGAEHPNSAREAAKWIFWLAVILAVVNMIAAAVCVGVYHRFVLPLLASLLLLVVAFLSGQLMFSPIKKKKK